MKIDEQAISKIEQLFGFKLYDEQRIYLLTGEDKFISGKRKQGKTFAYCIKLALSEGTPLDIKSVKGIKEVQDEVYDNYHMFFKIYFKQIWRKLKNNGFQVRVLK